MKNLVIILSLLFGAAFAQDNAMYMDAMVEALGSMKNTATISDRKATINQFERIAAVEADNWIPAYYVILNQTLMSFSMGKDDGDARDAVLDEAQKLLDALLKVNKEESELWALQGLVYQGRIQVSPMVRGMTYSGKATKAFEKAQAMNQDNPRAWMLHAQNVMYTPGFFGGGMDNACPLFAKALAKYETFENETPFWPSWGKGTAEKFAGKCEKEE